MKKIAIIPSGGFGRRLGESLPKQYLQIKNKEIIAYTISTFQESTLIDEIIIPAHKDYFDLLCSIKKKYNFTKITEIVEGGKERHLSVLNAVKKVSCEKDDLIIIHDAARPLLPASTLEKAIKSAMEYDNVTTAIMAKDTLASGDGVIKNYIDRKKVYYIQTPQIFRYNILMNSFDRILDKEIVFTDESSIVSEAGYDVKLVDGSLLNFKITEQDDLEIFKLIVNA